MNKLCTLFFFLFCQNIWPVLINNDSDEYVDLDIEIWKEDASSPVASVDSLLTPRQKVNVWLHNRIPIKIEVSFRTQVDKEIFREVQQRKYDNYERVISNLELPHPLGILGQNQSVLIDEDLAQLLINPLTNPESAAITITRGSNNVPEITLPDKKVLAELLQKAQEELKQGMEKLPRGVSKLISGYCGT